MTRFDATEFGVLNMNELFKVNSSHNTRGKAPVITDCVLILAGHIL
jgi:hypothetical protein